jgi:hypothetical protein
MSDDFRLKEPLEPPLTDADVDAFLGECPIADPAQVARIRKLFDRALAARLTDGYDDHRVADENPFDHNAECTYCDEQAAHRADCPWLMELLRENGRLRVALVALRVQNHRLIKEREQWRLGPAVAVPDCTCRTSGCGHSAWLHRGEGGACIVDGCRCGPGGWS